MLGGLLAGAVLTIGDVGVNGVLFGAKWAAALKEIGRGDGNPAVLFAFLILADMSVGVYIVWVYAAILPRFGPGRRTAAYSGLSVWVLASFLHAVAEAPMRIFPLDLYGVTVIAMLVTLPLAAIAGCRVYRD